MTKEQEIEKREELKRRLDVEIAFYNCAKIEYFDSTLGVGWGNITHPTWNWASYDYRIAEEPKQIPFDGSDAFGLIGRKFKFKHYCLYRIALDVDNERVYFRDSDSTYEDLADDYEIWNDLLKKFEPCTKVG